MATKATCNCMWHLLGNLWHFKDNLGQCLDSFGQFVALLAQVETQFGGPVGTIWGTFWSICLFWRHVGQFGLQFWALLLRFVTL